MIEYTCITREKDLLKDMPEEEGVRYIAFSDKVFKHKQWEYRPLKWVEEYPRLTSRKHKALSHELFPDEEVTMWIDGTVTFNKKPSEIVKEYLKESFIASRPHEARDCIYQELDAVLMYGFEEFKKIIFLIKFYKEKGYPRFNGLAETGLLIRKKGEITEKFNNTWWYFIKNGSVRDQCSFDYIHWSIGTTYDKIPREVINVDEHHTVRTIRE